MIRIVIAEDQKLLRGTLTALLSMEEDMEIVAEAENGQAAWEAIGHYEPDVCLLDIEIPFLSGLEIAERLRQEGRSTKIIIVTTFARPGFLQKAMELKVEGYLLKDEPIDFLIQSIRKVMAGERVISTDLAAVLFLREENPLTERETDVLRLSKSGLSTKEIAKQLFLTEGTVRNYLSIAIQKLGVQTRQQATEKANERGWIS
ncbi:two component transcriptional regulator, LuxR family [Paenibacillus uliginis N3/975]|uniref:Two component transcriptional regulator, LuxR family n=1 Tax=Paenibacillus uliginis N3/975 TaxID=1313296 RepID=A0A1X7HTS9_9BACL|nr:MULTISPECIES: response regulator transcription factor [Paenibacillus]UNK18411.1 response regulator transcription factor [Paenibacillus sp. N3/727]SMF92939.1 two component transcriptional regulator, LuxR family [Paenibacillus uliginis N3/975]